MRDVTIAVSLAARFRKFLLTRPMRDVTSPDMALLPMFIFLLTRPMRDVTSGSTGLHRPPVISTHTSHAGRDLIHAGLTRLAMDFYSHVPCGT